MAAGKGKCKFKWNNASGKWEKVGGQDHCHDGGRCVPPQPPPDGKPKPADGTIIIRLCK